MPLYPITQRLVFRSGLPQFSVYSDMDTSAYLTTDIVKIFSIYLFLYRQYQRRNSVDAIYRYTDNLCRDVSLYYVYKGQRKFLFNIQKI